MSFTAEFLPAGLIEPVGKFKDLMKEKSQQGEDKKVKAKMFLSVPEIMLDLITLVFKGVKAFIFYFPAATSGFN